MDTTLFLDNGRQATQLSEGEALLRTLTELSVDAVVAVDRDGRFRYANPAHARLTGYSAAEIVGQSFIELVHPDDRPLAAQQFAALVHNPEQAIVLETRVLHRDGSVRHVEASGKALPNGDFVGYLRDVTDSRQATVALRESEANFRTLVEISVDGIVIVRPDTMLEYANAPYLRAVGYDYDELIGHSFIPFAHPDDLDDIQARFAHLLEHPDQSMTAELRVRHKDGSWRMFEGVGKVLPNGNIVAYTRDITDRKQAEESLRLAQLRFRAVFEQPLLAVTIYGPDGKPRLWNTTFFGLAPDEIDQFFTTFNILDREGHLPGVQRAFAGEPTLMPPTAYPLGERTIWAQDFMYPVKDQTGAVCEVILIALDITAQKDAEDALLKLNTQLEQRVVERTAELRESEERFRIIAETSPFPVAITQLADGHILFANSALCELVALPSDQLVGRQSPDFWYDPSERGKFVEDLKRQGYVRNFEFHARRADGTPFWAAVSAQALTFAGERALLAALYDISDLKDAQVELERAEAAARARAEQLATLNRIGLAITSGRLDLDHVIRELYHQCQQVASVDAFYVSLYDPASHTVDFPFFLDRGEIAHMAPRDIRSDPGLTGEIVQTRKTLYIPDTLVKGQQSPVQMFRSGGEPTRSYLGVPLVWQDQVVGVFSIQSYCPDAYDASTIALMETIALQAAIALEQARLFAEAQQAKEAAETALAESKRLTAIIEATSDFVGIADATGQVLYINSAGRSMVGLGEEEPLTDYDFRRLFPAETIQGIEQVGVPVALREGAWNTELELLHRDGSTIPTSFVGLVHCSPEGAAASLSCIARDITQQKRTQAELTQSKEAAESASRAKSIFLANMSHEIRTPMNAVIGMTSLLLNTPLDTKQRDFVETIRTSGDALLTIINDILDFSKIEAGKLDLERQPFDLRTCIESALDLVAPKAAEKGIELAYVVEDDAPSGIVGDVTRLRQILVNLLTNAVKFTEQGEVVVSVRTENQEPRTINESPVLGRVPSGWFSVLFSVRDTGIGIPPDKLDRLFLSFSQLDASTTRQYGGTGLGLAISKRLSELMGGTMWAESDGIVGHGAIFHFTIRTQAAPVPVPIHLAGGHPTLAGKRLLIVDDNDTNRRILNLQAQTWGMLAQEVASAGEALELLRRGEPFDVAILDMHMPEMDGATLALEICKLRSEPRLPLIMLTSLGYEYRADVEHVACFAAYLTKPLKPSQLYDVLANALARGRTKRSVARPSQPARPAAQRLADRLPLRMLLAEDVVVNQKFALLALEEMGYTADVAANGQEALDALRRQPYDVILMDVQMPVLDGLEATRRIRREWPTSQQPWIVAMTANAMQGDRELCLEAGMDDYISKPVYLEELRAALERAGQPTSSSLTRL